MRMDLPLARMTYIPSTMMKITIDFDEISSKSTVTDQCQKVSPLRMNLAHFQRPHIAHSITE